MTGRSGSCDAAYSSDLFQSVRETLIKNGLKEKFLNKLILTIAASTVCGVAFAQVGTTVTEGAKATSQKAQQLGDQAKASVESQPDKTIDKTKAQVHKAKAHHHAKKAKDAATNAGDSAKDAVK